MHNQLPMSVAEFLQSESYTKGIILLQHYDEKFPTANNTNNPSNPPSNSRNNNYYEEEGRRCSISIDSTHSKTQSQYCDQHNNDNDTLQRQQQQQQQQQQQRQIVENATRVALMLTRSFNELCTMSKIGHADELVRYQSSHHHLSSIELDDFIINLDRNSSVATTAPPTTGESTHHHHHQQNNTAQRPSSGPLGNSNDFYEYYHQLISEKHATNIVQDRNGKVLGMGYFSKDCFGDSSSGDNDGIIVTDKTDSYDWQGQGTTARGDGLDEFMDEYMNKGFNNESTTNSNDNQMIVGSQQLSACRIGSGGMQAMYLYGMNVIPSKMNDIMQQQQQQQQQQHSMVTPMQILGKLLHSVFFQGEESPHLSNTIFEALFDTKPSASEDSNDDRSSPQSNTTRTTKTSRNKKTPIFSKLVDTKAFPISICRLLSDLIDTGREGKSSFMTDSPFTSFEDVCYELEQMISKPSMLLHDSHLSHGMSMSRVQQQQQQHHNNNNSSVLFGQVYYGRDEHIAEIIKVAAKIGKRQRRSQQLKQQQQSSTSPMLEDEDITNFGVESVFVSGIAGSGKSQLVQTATDYLSNLGWTFAKAKFERGAEHASRGIISSMFDEVVSHLVKWKEGGGSLEDKAISMRVSNAILDSIGNDFLPALVDFLPSLSLLFEGIDNDNDGNYMEDWQLIHSLSKILEAVATESGFVVMVCDDLQWADRTTLALISEVLAKLGENLRKVGHCCLFIGLYREDEVDDDHPFSIQYSYLQMSSNINTSEVKLSGLSKKDVADIIMAELRLPMRLVRELADVVYKKTSGHAYFIVELLNSLLRDNIISYSPKRYRYAWDQSRIDLIQTGESVAELIASNLSSLPGDIQSALRILSCFGIQTDIPLLQILEDFESGIISHLDEFIERGIIDRAGPILIFTHDLIQQEAYEAMSLAERHTLHLEIGQFLGELASIDDASSEYESAADSITTGMDELRLLDDQAFFVGSRITSSLISIACEQIDLAGPDAVADNYRRLIFSEWNLSAGQKTSHQSDFRAALYYFSKGIEFLGRECWLNDVRLCLALHEGAVSAAYALGEADQVVRYTEDVMSHVSLEDTLGVQQLLLRSLAQSGKHKECITRGVNILSQLDFDIPISPTMEIVMTSMASTDCIASPCGVGEIMKLCEKVVDESAHCIVKIMDAFYISCYASASAFLPLISCELVKYALKHGVCQESTVAFASYGMFKIFFEGDYAAGKKWADVVRAITEKHQSSSTSNGQGLEIRAHILLYITIDIWFSSPRDISQKLLNYHHSAVRMGEVDTAMISLQMGWRYLLYGGENLSIISKSFEDRATLIAKSSDYAAKYVALDYALLAELTGQSADKLADIEGMVCNIEVLQTEAEFVNNNRLLHHINVNNVMLAYWRGDYISAEKSSHVAWKYPTAKMPTIVLIYHTFYGGLIAFELFRTMGGVDGNKRLMEGRELMIAMGKWAQNSMAVFGNKWLLLSAEHSASIHEHDKCKKLYKASIKIAQDHGNIHELGLANQLFGNYCLSHECGVDANSCFKKAYTYYTQWGATAVAEKILRHHKLDLHTGDNTDLQVGSSKRSR